MMRGVGWYRVGFAMLGCLAVLGACSGGSFLAEREPWRKEAEARCMGSGTVREGAGIVRTNPINGPGSCGADFPLKVSTLGQPGLLGFNDDFRPPASIPNGSRPAPPRWPVVEPPPYEPAYEPRGTPRPPVESRSLPPPRNAAPGPAYEPGPRYEQPVSLDPPAPSGAPRELYDFRGPYGASSRPPAREPVRAAPLDPDSPAHDLSPEPYDHRRSMEKTRGKPTAQPRVQQRPDPPAEPRARATRRPPPLGPSRAPRVTGAVGTVTITPTATLACPLVSAVDEWFASAVQPAALRWFGQPVAEIRQISAYSCRGMNGNPRARISEHAFGNALDIASFTLADGRRITVKNGWRGSPEEQGFLRDVQAAACDRFTTVLAPGSNAFHADHFHVDLMKRSGGRKACNPRAVSGEEVAARVRAQYARQGRGLSFTGSVPNAPKGTRGTQPTAFAEDKVGHQLPIAIPGEDGAD